MFNVWFVLACVPETKGRSLEEMQAHFEASRLPCEAGGGGSGGERGMRGYQAAEDESELQGAHKPPGRRGHQELVEVLPPPPGAASAQGAESGPMADYPNKPKCMVTTGPGVVVANPLFSRR